MNNASSCNVINYLAELFFEALNLFTLIQLADRYFT